MSPITVNTRFDGGSIIVKDIKEQNNLRFSIRNDTNSHFAQWFYFQLNGVKNQEISCYLDELDKTAYPKGWENYNVCASYDNQNWFRIPSTFADDTLSWSISPTCNSIYFAYFEPYSYTRHQELIANANSHPLVKHEQIGLTLEQRPLDLLTIGNPQARNKIWIIARQHPGETMSEWFMEGLITRLINDQDALSKTLLADCVFYLVPNMNPDGAYNGNLRTNLAGMNLNREWLNPSLEKSPEVYLVREKMLATGVDMFFDIHGDEALPYVFTAGCGDNQSYSPKQQRLEQIFEEVFTTINPDYQTQYGYERGHFTVETPTIATSWVGNQFDCLAFTLEMPFKDNANLPDEHYGWNGYRSYLLGQDLLTAISFCKKALSDN